MGHLTALLYDGRMELKWEGVGGSRRHKLCGWQAVPLVGTIFLVLGSGFLVMGVVLGLITSNFVENGRQAQATVVSLQAVSGDNGVTYAPVFQYSGADGREHTVTSHASSSPAGFSVGERVNILYSSKDPEDARIDTLWQLWGFPLIFCPLGGLFALVGAILLLVLRRRFRQTARG